MKLRKLTGILLSVTMLFGGSTAVLADTEMEKPDTVEAKPVTGRQRIPERTAPEARKAVPGL